MNKEEIDILYSFANDEDCRYVYDWQGFNYEEICPLIDKLIKENKKQKEVISRAIEYIKEKARNNCWIDQYESCDLIKILKGVE